MIRVLIADDSTLARELIKAILQTDPEIEIAGEAANGGEAVRMAQEFKPNIITMDIEMPVMDGLQAIEEIMASNATPILVVTTRGDAPTAYSAIAKGALDLIQKPEINFDGAWEFVSKVKMLSKVRVITHIKGRSAIQTVSGAANAVKPVVPATSDRIVAIASSTGGPDALSVILSSLPENFPCPVVIAQHMSDGFISGMADWLKRNCRLTLKIGDDGESIAPGVIYISPSERHMMISKNRTIMLKDRQPTDIFRPSCDMLLTSVADVYGPKSVGVILTGMGSDGVVGMKKIKDMGGATIAQNEKTSVVFGMPKVAIDSGCIDRILPVNEISSGIVETIVRRKSA